MYETPINNGIYYQPQLVNAGFQPSTVGSNLQMARPNLQTPGAPAGHCLIEEGPVKKKVPAPSSVDFSHVDLGNIDRKHVIIKKGGSEVFNKWLRTCE